MRKFAWLLPLALLVLLALFLWQNNRSALVPRSSSAPDGEAAAIRSTNVPSPSVPGKTNGDPEPEATTQAAPAAPVETSARFLGPPFPGPVPKPIKVLPFGEELTRSASAEEDIQVIDGMLGHFRKHFSENPIGANWEITAALTGANPKRIGYINADHPAINKQGELCDRWGRPFWFHSDSGTEMNIISLGPDGTLDTKDDIRLYEPDSSF